MLVGVLFVVGVLWVGCHFLSKWLYGSEYASCLGHLEWDTDQHDFMIPQKPDNSGKFWEKNKEVKDGR